MTPTVISLLLISCWMLGAILTQQLCAWCTRFVRRTAEGKTRGWGWAVALVAPFIAVFGAGILVCALMALRYTWQLAVITWPSLAAYLPIF